MPLGQIRKLLVDQIVQRVRWRETVSYMYREGTSAFYEVGVGKVLSGMVKRVVSNAKTINLASYDDILSTIESLNNANFE